MQQAEFAWNPADTTTIEKNFKKKASELLRKHLHRARVSERKPKWISQENWEEMKNEWAHESFAEACEKNKNNRLADAASASTIYRGGSISITAHSNRMVSHSL